MRLAKEAALAQRAAVESGKMILRYFGPGTRIADPAVEAKADDTPVTRADREAEDFIRREIMREFPGHQVLGEEAGLGKDAGVRPPGDTRFQWIVDPIDGTKSFVMGVPLFGTLIALLDEGRPVLGVVHLPALGQLLLGIEGLPTTLNGQEVRVSPADKLEDATLLFTSPSTLFEKGHGEAFHRLRKRVRLVRSWGDCYGHYLVAAGRAEIMMDPILNLWDVAPLKPILEGAGGTLTTVEGEPSGTGTSALSTNTRLHQEVLEILRGE
ncbi:MAG: histidinol-phosphatase [Deltaproteobacteria bacterium]|nr:histidinol-phosphatase [Deltaproteobacteria bacterium]